MKPADTHLTPGAGTTERRWFSLEAASVSSRFHFIETAQSAIAARNGQFLFAARGHVALDSGGRFVVNAAASSGNTFLGGWNNLGLGTGRAQSSVSLKQLNLQVRPRKGVEVQYGGIDFARGESSEITSYDFDGYLVGGRVRFEQPRRLFFDEISVTYAYLSDLNRPNVFSRLHGLGRSNYHQFLVTKAVGRRLRVSADYTSESGIDTWRQAATLRAPRAVRVADRIRFEQYEVTSPSPGYGFAMYGERAVHRLSLGAGYAQLDRRGL